jgi:hypothetical protein
MLAKACYILLATYGLYAAIMGGLGLWKFGIYPFEAFEELGAVALLGLGAMGAAGRLSPRLIWSAAGFLVVADLVWRAVNKAS